MWAGGMWVDTGNEWERNSKGRRAVGQERNPKDGTEGLMSESVDELGGSGGAGRLEWMERKTEDRGTREQKEPIRRKEGLRLRHKGMTEGRGDGMVEVGTDREGRGGEFGEERQRDGRTEGRRRG